MIRMIKGAGLFFVFCALSGGLVLAAGGAPVIAAGKTVKFDYILKADQKVVESSRDRGGPVTFVQGKGEMMPALEKQLEGMKAGDKKVITILPEESYGPVNPEAVMEVPSARIPAEAVKAGVGAILDVPDKDGKHMLAQIKEVRGETVLVDFNHPLAGKTLEFDVEIVEVV